MATAQVGDIVRFSTLIQNRLGPDDPRLAPHAVGDLIPVSCVAGRSGPIPFVEITASLGADLHELYPGGPQYGDYWKFEGVVRSHQEAGVVPAYSDQLEHHLSRLASGD